MTNKVIYLWWFLVFLFPVAVTWVPFFIINSSRTIPLTLADELFPLLLQSIFVSAPFAILAIWSKKKLKNGDQKNIRAVFISGILVFILYSALAAWFLIDVFNRRSGGADIGAGILLMISPFILPAVMIVTYQILKRK